MLGLIASGKPGTRHALPVLAFFVVTMVILSVALTPRTAAAATVSIALRPQALAGKPVVQLGDVADLTTDDPRVLRRLMALSLGSAPPQGRKVVVPASKVRDWVRQQLGIVASWSGAEAVEIVRALPAVTRGTHALLAWRSGLVELEARVEVLQDGQPGQTVRVRGMTGPGTLLARVVGPGRLEGIGP